MTAWRLVWAVFLLAACGERWSPPGRALPQGPVFDHAEKAHAGLLCTACHAAADVAAGRPARPGSDHAPCDGCHQEVFSQAPSAFCNVCHEAVSPGQPGQSPLLPFPPVSGERELPSRFAHASHLDSARSEAKVGFHVDCVDCHVAPGRGQAYPQVSHAACARCHDSVAPRMQACVDCHDGQRPAVVRGRHLARADVTFSHDSHERDASGTAVRCRECHVAAEGGDRLIPTLAPCVTCHDDVARTPANHAMRRCAGCHVQAFSGLRRQVAPRSHLAAELRPGDHTLAFRQDHAEAAQRNPRRCATCHAGLSGSAEGCGECHQTMAPMDHGAAWPDFLHGEEAFARPARCAVCHEGDFCTTCHARAPRSHLPLTAWRGLPGQPPGHGQAARAGLRACLVCHDPDESCAGSGCHGPGGPP